MECLSKREKSSKKYIRIKSTVDCNERSGRFFFLCGKIVRAELGIRYPLSECGFFYNLKCSSEILYINFIVFIFKLIKDIIV